MKFILFLFLFKKYIILTIEKVYFSVIRTIYFFKSKNTKSN